MPTEIKNGEIRPAASFGRKVIAQAKARYVYPWWASKDALEIFWGQLNETVQIVPLDKFHVCAKEAMNREVFADELGDRESLMEEFIERIPKAAFIALTNKFQKKQNVAVRQAS
jgi:hypothetical protein